MPDREYPTGALAALDPRVPSATEALDALATMSPEDRAALARWLDPEPLSEEARVRRIQAATVKRVTEWLRSEDVRAGTYLLAEAIDKRFGGPDAVK